MKRNAFTIPEVLTVTGIVGLLIGILVPSLGKARETAKDVACRATLYSTGQSFEAYANVDRNNFYPKDDDSICPGYRHKPLITFANEQRENGKGLLCPKERENFIIRVDNKASNANNSAQAAYSLEPAFQTNPIKSGQRHKGVPAPLAFDFNAGSKNLLPGQNHLGGGNVLYTDAHVEYLPQEKWESKDRPAKYGQIKHPGEL